MNVLSRGDLLGLVSDCQPLVGNKNDSTQNQSIGSTISKMKDAPLGQTTGFSGATTDPASSSSKKVKRTYKKKKQYKFEDVY